MGSVILGALRRGRHCGRVRGAEGVWSREQLRFGGEEGLASREDIEGECLCHAAAKRHGMAGGGKEWKWRGKLYNCG